MTIDGALEISQTFSSICVRAFFEKSESESIAAFFSKINDKVYLFYTYDNDPNTLKNGTMQMHKGTGKLLSLNKEKKLKGIYWNSIGNYGDMLFDFESRELKERF